MNPAIVMYAKTTCPYCHAAERLLRERGVSRIEMILIDEQPRRRPEMIDRSGGRTTVPQIFIGERHVGGCDDLYELDATGGLVPLLAAYTEPRAEAEASAEAEAKPEPEARRRNPDGR